MRTGELSRAEVSPAETGIARRPAPLAIAPAGDPVLGHLRRLRSDALALFREGAAAADLVCFRALHRRVYLVVGPELIAHVGVHNRGNYVKGVSYEALRVPIPDSLLTTDGEDWARRRRLLLPMFSRRALLERLPAIVAAVEGLGARWDRLASSRRPLDLVSEMNRLAFDAAGRVLVGERLADEMAELEGLIGEASDWVARRTRALLPLPVSVPTRRNRELARARTLIRGFAERLIASRRARGDPDDMVTCLIEAEGAGDDMDDRQLRDEVIGFLMAGHQTTGAALAWTWYLLGRHPEVAERVRREVDEADGAGAPGPEYLERLPYLGAVLDESMRLYPPGWAFTRTALADDELGGTAIPAGSTLVISSYANQRCPRFWASPEAFEPDRFSAEADSPSPYHYFPFGIGPHACIGRQLALIEARLALAMLARRYRLGLVSAGPVAPEPGITLTPRDPMLARVERRS